jgi:RHS repeat-associated protein
MLLFSFESFSQLTGTDYLTKPARVISWQVNVEGKTTVPDAQTTTDKIKTYKYFDGFGRLLQDIIEGATPAGKDLIQLYSYDGFGRQTKSYLPFEYTSVSTGEPYQDRATAISNQASYYTTGTTAGKIPYDAKPWVQSGVEESPLQRLLKQGSVGNGFQTDEHYKTVNYRASVSGDNVKKWAPDGSSASTYSANELQVSEGTDEASATIAVFTDKMGRMVLKRQQVTSTPTWLDTYYIYDLLGNLAWVVPPKAVAKLSSIGGTWNVTSVPNLVFSYVYDYKNRVIEKKVPGAEVVYIIYDPLDRVVLVQSGNLRSSNKWLYSKYDASGRVITEGVYTDATHTTRSGMQSYVDGLSCYGSSSTTYYEARTTGTASYYTNSCFPTSGTEERLYYYYDDYDTDNDGSADFAYSSQGLSGEGPVTALTRGMPTAINKRIIGASNWLRSVSFYDKRLNPLQVKSDNQLRALLQDHTTTVIDFAGRLNIKNEYHSTSSTANITVRADYSYDVMKRLTEVGQVINSSSRVIVARYEYNALGSLVDKKLHSTNGTSYLQSVDYRYNIRGQLTSINNSTLTSDGGTTNDESNDLWGMDLLYEQQEYCAPGSCDVEVINNTANWTGRISAVKWKASVSGGNTDQRAYVFSYDLAGRMSAAKYIAYNNSTTGWTKHPNGYNEEVSYDENGNIATMLRKAVITASVTTIDSMSYDYGTAADNNQLLNMTESGSNSYGYRNFTSNSSGYSYDNNGNLTADAKKGTTITYNELNKPVRITDTSTSKYVEYGYDAAGVRLSKTVYDGSTTKTYNYIAGQFYDENNALSYFSMAEGRVRNASGTFIYEYFITDHQGNVRVSFEDNGSGTAVVRQENSYYPFGMAMPGNTIPSSPNKHLYNAGSELQDEFSGIIDYYSTFFREYDPVLGRFNGVDPQASATMELSIYHYSFNDPVNFNDPMGDKAAAPTTNAGDLLQILLSGNINLLEINEYVWWTQMTFTFGGDGQIHGVAIYDNYGGG